MKLHHLFLVAFVGGVAARGLAQPFPPLPPASGPGSTNYFFQGFSSNSFGVGANEYWIFEPRSPQPASAPLIVFNHGYNATNPVYYTGWIKHIVQRGNIVIYPRYQSNSTSPAPSRYITNALAAVTNAIQWLTTNGTSTLPQLDKFAIVGHSVGGVLTANMTAAGQSFGLPPVRAAMCSQPGKSWGQPLGVVPLFDLSQISANTLLLSVASTEDELVFDTDAINVFQQSINVPATNKDLLLFRSDYHNPNAPLLANHVMSNSGEFGGLSEPDALDYLGLWKLFDALTDTAFYGTNRSIALGGATNQTSLGNWSDGVPVNPLVSISAPVPLKISLASNQSIVSWTPAISNFVLQSSAALGSSANWQTINSISPPTNGTYSATQTVVGSSRFFRLLKP